MEKIGLNELRQMFQEFYQGKDHYARKSFSLIPEKDKRLAFLSESVLGLCTYDMDLDVYFGREIFEVMKVIYNKKNFEYIKDEDNYKIFMLVCNLLNKNHWIEWGTSIRGCWFNESENIMLNEYSQETFELTNKFLKWFLYEFLK
jgi:hypothetical protein